MASTQAKASHNSIAQASGNLGVNSLASEVRTAACRLIKSLGLVPSYRNLYIVQLAIQSESEFSSCSAQQAADNIIEIVPYARQLGECVNYFWFEDGGWRHPKLTFKQRDDLDMRRRMAIGT